MKTIKTRWPEVRDFCDDRGLPLQWIDHGSYYIITCTDGPLTLQTKLAKVGPNQSHVTEFESLYKAAGNKTIEPVDNDFARIVKTKTTKTGWHYEPRFLDFRTSAESSLYNKKADGGSISSGTDYGDGSLLFFDENGQALVDSDLQGFASYQELLDSRCCKTCLDWQPAYEMDVIGGSLQIKDKVLSPAYVWCVIAPDIPEVYGGSVPYFAGGLALHFFANNETISFDGRGIKNFAYDPVYNSNKFRFIVKHAVGEKIDLQIMIDQFKE